MKQFRKILQSIITFLRKLSGKKIAMKKSLSAYLKNGTVYFRGHFLTDAPLPVTKEGGMVFTAELVDAVTTGRQLLLCLAEAGGVIPAPADYKEDMRNDLLLKAVGVKTWNMLTKTCTTISIRKREEGIRFIPYRRVRHYYEECGEKSFTCLSEDPEELGKAVAAAFALCE